jgi:hypothetical protein
MCCKGPSAHLDAQGGYRACHHHRIGTKNLTCLDADYFEIRALEAQHNDLFRVHNL